MRYCISDGQPCFRKAFTCNIWPMKRSLVAKLSTIGASRMYGRLVGERWK